MTANLENVTHWRHLADQLTAEQVDALARIETKISGDPNAAGTLLEIAQGCVLEAVVDVAYADIPAPPDCIQVGPWEQDADGNGWSRSLLWRDGWNIGAAAVCVDGRQHQDGHVEQVITLYGGDGSTELSVGQARRLAAALLDAADTLDQLA
jgi:hypothetical protein